MLENKEGPMDQRWICGSMLTAGLGLFGVVAWIQTDRYALTQPNPASEAESVQMVIAPAKPAETINPVAEEAADQVLEMPLDSIVVRRRAPAATPPAAAPESREPSPCSPWQEIGPVHVDDGAPTGVRRFRKLC
jgi:hypothetical protein